MSDNQRKQSAWERFEKTGSAEAYLYYRAICEQGGGKNPS